MPAETTHRTHRLEDAVAAIRAAAAARTPHWQLLALDRRETTAELAGGRIDAARAAQETTASLRLVVDGRVGTATTSRPDRVDDLVQDAWDCARHGPEAEQPTAPLTPGSPRCPSDEGQRTGDAPPTADEVLAGTGELADRIADLQRRSGLQVHGTITRVDETVHIASPAGAVRDRLGHWGVSAVAESPDAAGVQLSWHAWTRRPALAGEVTDWTAAAGTWRELPALPCPTDLKEVLLAPAAVHALLSPVLRSLGGPATQGRSFLPADLGERLLDKRLTVTDGAHPGAPTSSAADGLPRPAVDDEGVACRPLVLVEAGTPCRRYHTRHSAAAAGVPPTGHGFRGSALRRKPLQPVSAVLGDVRVHADPPLTAPWRDLLSSVGSGIVVESLLGAEQKGRLSPVVEAGVQQGFVVRHGRVVGLLRRTRFRMDVREALGAELAGVSTQRWPVSRVWTGTLPFLLVRAGNP